MTENDTKPPTETKSGEARHGIRHSVLEIDYALYERYLEESEWNDEQKREFIETLWSVVIQFVDLGFEIHPLQQACGQNGTDPSGELVFDAADMVAFDQENSSENITNNAVRPFGEAAERKET